MQESIDDRVDEGRVPVQAFSGYLERIGIVVPTDALDGKYISTHLAMLLRRLVPSGNRLIDLDTGEEYKVEGPGKCVGKYYHPGITKVEATPVDTEHALLRL